MKLYVYFINGEQNNYTPQAKNEYGTYRELAAPVSIKFAWLTKIIHGKKLYYRYIPEELRNNYIEGAFR